MLILIAIYHNDDNKYKTKKEIIDFYFLVSTIENYMNFEKFKVYLELREESGTSIKILPDKGRFESLEHLWHLCEFRIHFSLYYFLSLVQFLSQSLWVFRSRSSFCTRKQSELQRPDLNRVSGPNHLWPVFDWPRKIGPQSRPNTISENDFGPKISSLLLLRPKGGILNYNFYLKNIKISIFCIYYYLYKKLADFLDIAFTRII